MAACLPWWLKGPESELFLNPPAVNLMTIPNDADALLGPNPK